MKSQMDSIMYQNMNRLVRKSVFETNSSSSHSLSISGDSTGLYGSVVDQVRWVEGVAGLDFRDSYKFDDHEDLTLKDPFDKLAYLSAICNSFPWEINFNLDTLYNVVRRNLECKEVLFYGIDRIDSDLYDDILDQLPYTESELYDLIFDESIELQIRHLGC